jgi:hypothetical protein
MVVTPFCSKSPTCAASSTVFPDGAERKSGRNRQSHYQVGKLPYRVDS